ncbi:hypothetical protein [Umezawaea beigongshangensis]|uniref:hypothetical protein n=1 Tax=Umezawaea beigongshangensis TaxID=2780383 RepID=UPI0018F12543|nr:hypothetical protein [Umezawaea beigongshangensis]
MTDTRLQDVLDRSADRAADPRGHRLVWALLGLLVLGLALVAVAVAAFRADNSAQAAAITTLSQQAADSHAAAQALADQVERLGGVPVVQPPESDPAPVPRGIVGTAIEGGHLIVAYSDGTTEDKGRVVGDAGRDGTNGESGRGVASSSIVGDRLILAYTDGTAEDLGPIVGDAGRDGANGADGADGADGRGIASSAIVDGRLVLTYTDGTTQDVGPLPSGRPGRGVQRAEVVDCRWRVTYTDGVTEDAGDACTTQTETAIPPPAPSTTDPPPPLLPTVR